MTFRRRTTFPGLDPRANKELIGLQDDLLQEQRSLREEAIGRTRSIVQSGTVAAAVNSRIPCLPVAAGADLVFPLADTKTSDKWIEVLKLGGGDVRIQATGGTVQGAALATLTTAGFYYYQSDSLGGWWTQPTGSGGGLTPPVALTDLQNIGPQTWLGNNTGGAGPILELTQAQMKTYLGVFGAATTGLVPASGGGTVNFLRADGTFAPPPGGGSVTMTDATITLPYAGTQSGTANVVDAAILVGSRVGIFWGTVLSTDANEPEADDVTFTCTPAAGSMTVRVSSDKSPVGGPYKIRYLIG